MQSPLIFDETDDALRAAVMALVGLLKRTGALEEIIAAEVSAAKAAPSLVRAA